MKLLPVKVRTLIMNITPWKALHEVRDMVNYMHEISVEIYHEKKRALEEGDEAVVRQIGQGKDLLSILREYSCLISRTLSFRVRYAVRENMKVSIEDKLEEEEIIAQVEFLPQ